LLVLLGCGKSAPHRERHADPGWRIVATSVGDSEILAVKAIREVTGLGLKDAKDLADALPSVILSGISRGEAEAAADTLRKAGMSVEVRPE